MGNHKLQTSIMVRVGEAEIELNATVVYYRHEASGDGWNEPREPAYCEIVDILVHEPGRNAYKLHERFVENLHDGLQSEMMEDWADERADAAERRAEQARDDFHMMGVL